MPQKKLNPYFIELVQDALLKSFWYKKTLRAFLRRSHISQSALSSLLDTDTKREWLDQLFPRLEGTPRGQALLIKMGRELSQQETFPDLQRHEDSEMKTAEATQAIAALRKYLRVEDAKKADELQEESRRKQAEQVRSDNMRTQRDLGKLAGRLTELTAKLGTKEAGYEFQVLFYDLMDFADVENRRPYNADGRQIDGSITIDGTTYLVELKFTAEPTGSPDIDTFDMKLRRKADNTMGLFVSMSGFTMGKTGDKGAVATASYDKTPLLLLDHGHLMMVLQGITTFDDVVRRVRRHASQTGEAYLPVNKFGSG